MEQKIILIPIKASEEKPPKKNKQISIPVRRVPDFREVEYDFHYKEWFETSSGHYQVIVKYWYKPVLEDEYKKEIIIDLLNNHLDTWEYANCGNVEEVAQEYINYIKSKLTEK